MENQRADPPCECGRPPYTDGALCPACQMLYLDDLIDRIDGGEITPTQATAMLVAASPPAYGEDEVSTSCLPLDASAPPAE